MKFQNLKLTILFLTALTVSSCKMDFINNSINGKGPVVEKEFSLDKTFDAVQATSGWDVELIQSDNPHLVVRTQENIIPVFRYKIKKGKLTISFKENTNIRNVKVQEVKVYYKALSEIGASSSASVSSEEIFEQEKLTLKTSSGAKMQLHLKTSECSTISSSSSQMKLDGTSIHFDAKASSGSKLLASDLKTKKCTVTASSSSSIKTQALQTLLAKASSGGNIKLKAETESATVTGSSSGKIELQGSSEDVEISASSGSAINATTFKVKNCIADASSSASIKIQVTGNLEAKTSSGGSITYSGNPSKTKLDQSTSGGKIKEK